MKKLFQLAFICGAFVAALFSSGCAISKNVHSVQKGTVLGTVYVAHNDRVLMKECTDEIVKQFKELGFDAKRYDGDRPTEAKYYMTYTANWTWDMAMYLTYFRGTLYDEGRVLGEIEYDAKMGGANMGKFGKTAEKLRPLLTQLLRDVERSKAAPVAVLGTGSSSTP